MARNFVSETLAKHRISLTNAAQYPFVVVKRAKQISSHRFALVALAFSIGVALIAATPVSGSTDQSGQDRPEPRIVKGKGTSIGQWPWQVALTDRSFAPRGPATARYFCSGSLVAPDLVVTAAHCVSFYRPATLDNVRIIAGRTWLNDTAGGEILGVDRVVMPLDSNGRPRYRIVGGAAVWDVALIKLASPSSATPIAIAGQSEKAAWSPGRLVKTTGWGETRPFSGISSNRLRVATQVVLPDGVCRRDGGYTYQPQTMICLGGPRGGASACTGDSGGPLVSRVGGGWRLIGLTSFGDAACRGNVPSVDNRTAADPVRSWIRAKAIELSGYDPVSEGGAIGPLPRSCQVPSLLRRTRVSARKALRSAGCSLGAIRPVGRPGKGKRRVVGASLPAGWLAPLGFGIRIAVTR